MVNNVKSKLSTGKNFSVELTSLSGLTTLVAELGVNLEVNLNTSFRVKLLEKGLETWYF